MFGKIREKLTFYLSTFVLLNASAFGGYAMAQDALEEIVNARLVLVGAGIEWEESVQRFDDPRWKGRLHCIPRLPYEELKELTASADLGLSLDKALHTNYQLSLPNKLFDFIHVGLPIVANPMVEVKKVVEEYGVGVVASEVSTPAIAKAVGEVLSKPKSHWRTNCLKARGNLHWGADTHIILEQLEGARKQPWVKT